jgi:hypothetical protein
VCSRRLLEQTASNNDRTRHTEVAGLLYDREIACVTEVIVKEINTKYLSFFPEHSQSKNAINLITFGPATNRFSLRLVSAGNLEVLQAN